MKTEKLSKGFKISYIINCIIFAIVLFWIITIFTYDSRNLLEDFAIGFVYVALYIIHFIISLCILIITTILGIKNYKTSISSNTKKNITLMMSILGVLHIIMLSITIVTILLA